MSDHPEPMERIRDALARHAGPGLRPLRRSDLPRIPAAVLVPLLGKDEITVLMTVRASGLRHHAGEVCFPGGKSEPQDDSLEVTALRETEEETGLSRHRVQILGSLSPVPTATSPFVIYPFVGRVEGAPSKTMLSPEVDRMVYVSIKDVAEGRIGYWLAPVQWKGHEVQLPYFTYDEQTSIYGASAIILAELFGVIMGCFGLKLPEPRRASSPPWEREP